MQLTEPARNELTGRLRVTPADLVLGDLTVGSGSRKHFMNYQRFTLRT